MTMPASYAKLFGDGLPSSDDKAAANQLRQILAAQISSGRKTRLALADDEGQMSRSRESAHTTIAGSRLATDSPAGTTVGP